MIPRDFKRIGIIGAGLLGTSLALALREARFDGLIVMYDKSQARLREAIKRVGDGNMSGSVSEIAATCDCLFIATPIQSIDCVMEEIGRLARAGTLVTDVVSVKEPVERSAAAHLPKGVDFVGGHPMAGSDRTGPEYAQGKLFFQAPWIVTSGSSPARKKIETLIGATGAKVIRMTAKEHDQVIAKVSHLPHVCSAVMTSLLSRRNAMCVGSGFKDVTRIAMGDPFLWTGILMKNRKAIIDELDGFMDQLNAFRAVLEKGEDSELFTLLEGAAIRREALGSDKEEDCCEHTNREAHSGWAS